MRLRALALGAALTLVGMVASGNSAVAYTYTPHDLALSAIDLVKVEAALLVEFNAFSQPVPEELRAAHEELVYSIDSMKRVDVVDWFDSVDFAGAAVLDQMRTINAPVSRATADAMARFPTDVLKRIATDSSGTVKVDVPPNVYVRAMVDLRQRDGAPAPGEALASAPAVVKTDVTVGSSRSPNSQGLPNSSRLASTNAASERRSLRVMAFVVVVAVVLLLAVLGTVVAVVRRRPAPGDPVDVDELMHAGRRISSCTSLPAVWDLAVREALAMVTGSGAAAVVRAAERLEVVAAVDLALSDADLADSVVTRVADTGHSATGRLGSGHGVAVAVISKGAIAGTVVVARDEPFTPPEVERLGHLAPLIATGLDHANRHASLSRLTVTDALTQLSNRRRLDEDLALIDTTGITSFVMVDIDHFKSFNDTHGHPAGDDLLRAVASVMSDNVRPGDVLYRYGGEEFAVLLPGANVAEAAAVAERLVNAVRVTDFPGGHTQPLGRVTVSAGVAGEAGVSGTVLNERADGALYDAKRSGRDRVVVAPWSSPVAGAQSTLS